ncbi:sigma-54 interaction domain-containing protein [Papillibacter cinnamivorans]|uniref:Transcriptional regulator containing PAS, AAA-type ATPase, and DNA-binding Fis domains n=1 Tax=Papillibacter cinnamivorans DSM 12816 TaxID=1122930 RepID=A0A1W1ZJ82_9FIRM|nr:sigma 54-interacting transcriptional regulator [Papillibacter cinnamivorans]SMC48081.1 Transcriptional regulator containing PAS, AAA-type ATPase, and DNA-binding Fis domains [Papillibacter cinnamivorans DSM 12816]
MGAPIEQDELLKHLVDALYLCIVIDAGDIVRYISQAYANILESDRENIIGKDVRAVIPNTKLPEVVKSGKPIPGEIFIMHNGEATICNRFPILGEDGTVQGAFSTATFQNLDLVERLSEELKHLRMENKIYQKQLGSLTRTPFTLDFVIGGSSSIQQLKEEIGMVANTDLTVLITGETGVGKEIFANALHQLSGRKSGPYIKVNCAAIPKDLLEAELFGYSEGAFSGAAKGGKAGKFEQANHGTILLDEIGDLSLDLQSKLLRVLQEREVERIGGLKTKKLDFRVICNTNQNLDEMAARGDFRQDLYYRINVIELFLPPLRERLEDLPALCRFFIDKINRNHGCMVSGISDRMLEIFQKYSWPGNVRELEHVLERAAVLSPSGVLEPEDFRFFLPRAFQSGDTLSSDSLQDQKRKAESDAIRSALLKTGGNKTKASQLLHIPRSLLYEKIKRYHIE